MIEALEVIYLSMVLTPEEKEAAKVAKEAEKEAAKVAVTSVTVSWKGKSRVYSKAIHGDDFLALAEQFAKKFGGVIA